MTELPTSAPNLPPPTIVVDPAGWQACLTELHKHPRIAIDLEANSMYAYRERVCLIQISIPGRDYILDPLCDLDLEPLGQIIGDPTIEKIFHAAEYDLMMLSRQYDWTLVNLFDTMLAARILGYKRIGLASLLHDFHHIKLDKKYQRANWCQRPLRDELLAYAQADTHFLFDLRERFARELDAAGRMREAQEIFTEQCDIIVPDLTFNPDNFWSINGVRKLPPHRKAITRALYIFRDEQAKRRDMPAFKIFGDKTLVAIAERAPRTSEQLREIKGMSHGQVRRYGTQILKLIKHNRGKPAPKRPKRPKRPADDVLVRYEALQNWRKKLARKRKVESDVIIGRSAMWAIARSNPQTRPSLSELNVLGEWRLEQYGEEILAILGKYTKNST